ncbi:tRNA methyltransferase 44 [Modicella reniformis]|uniref:tRNA (uracil-O(2)-)-methyltransferase n=1 Tax=Modicella reniformis TaxID=1440133 RepID=A0A9P6MB69_9FUNG|nr:tRNA methyltransferase 44 [Modicella reniformis]
MASSSHSKNNDQNMSGEGPLTSVEFVYDATFYFDDLPNNHKETQVEESLSPKWYPAAKAPVPFSEDIFWSVLGRWILEAPSVIPPIDKVEVLHDHDYSHNTDSTKQVPSKDISAPDAQDSRTQLLLESRIPFRIIRRRLLPKRINKDPIMEERLYFIRSIIMPSATTSHAIFAPKVNFSTEEGSNHDEIQAISKSLPFFYPKVRGFRYGYITDPEEAPEDRDDHNHQDQDYNYEQEEKDDVGINIDTTKGNKKTSKRLGWITLDLFMAGDEKAFSSKMELFKKLYKWGVNATKGFTKNRVQHDIMVPKELYLQTYARLKETHAQNWVQSWPERTDPRKFVFEDIAIASWLVALWSLERAKIREDREQEREQDQELVLTGDEGEERKQTFVDLGCGNGLLTHILNEEGHKGTGIDIVSRKVWTIYGAGTQLEAKTIIPNETVFANVDWIIGNHADELAPWIPIIAMRSKPLTNRYQFPKGAPDGKYKAYQDYICHIIETCGYDLQTEILRIPSTKNVALVGMTKKQKRKPQTQHSSTHANQTREGEIERKDQGYRDSKKEEDDGEDDYHDMVDDLVRRSGLFVARVSDKDKQELQRTRQAAKLLARELLQEHELDQELEHEQQQQQQQA